MRLQNSALLAWIERAILGDFRPTKQNLAVYRSPRRWASLCIVGHQQQHMRQQSTVGGLQRLGRRTWKPRGAVYFGGSNQTYLTAVHPLENTWFALRARLGFVDVAAACRKIKSGSGVHADLCGLVPV